MRRCWELMKRILPAMLCLLIFVAAFQKIRGTQVPMVFGVGIASVVSGSMEPEIPVGSLVVVKQVQDAVPGEVVVYEGKGNLPIAHRVIAADHATLTTKGDANNKADDPIDRTQLIGKVIAVVPKAGTFLQFINKHIVFVAGAACLLMGGILPRLKKKENEYEEQETEQSPQR